MFEVFRYARNVSRRDSQLYEDSADLQKFFIQTREQLCKNGEVLLTPALSYQEVHLLRDLEVNMHVTKILGIFYGKLPRHKRNKKTVVPKVEHEYYLFVLFSRLKDERSFLWRWKKMKRRRNNKQRRMHERKNNRYIAFGIFFL